jgi:hypothetical protein
MFFDNTNNQRKPVNGDTLNKKINIVMQRLLIWFHVNGLVINTEKTIAMSSQTWQNKSLPQLIVKEMNITYKYEKNLWVYI